MEKFFLEKEESDNVLTGKDRLHIQNDICSETGMRSDQMHDWDGISRAQLQQWTTLRSVRLYSEYFLAGGTEKDIAATNYTLNLSNDENVKKYDEIVRRYNRDLERIKKEKDYQALVDFYNEISHVVYGSLAIVRTV